MTIQGIRMYAVKTHDNESSRLLPDRDQASKADVAHVKAYSSM